MNVPLKSLGLERKWPELARTQGEISDLEKGLDRARSEVQRHKAQLDHARGLDIAAEAEAYRSSKKPPEPVHEPRVRSELEAAERRVSVLGHALQAAREDLGGFLLKHQGALHADVVQARRKVAARLSEHARACLAEFGRHEDLARVVKDLTPAEPLVEGAPAQRLTTSFIGLQTTQPSGLSRGNVEQVLGYLVALAPEDHEGDDAAA